MGNSSKLVLFCTLFLTVLQKTTTVVALQNTISSRNLVANPDDCPCGDIPKPPNFQQKEEVARWMVHSLDFGFLSTISSRLSNENDGLPIPFGNVYSFVDGTCTNSTGIIYLYGTYMDQSFIDVSTMNNNMVSFTLSEATLKKECLSNQTATYPVPACTIHSSSVDIKNRRGDPENPVCAKLVITGKLVQVAEENHEYNFAKHAFFTRHPSMEEWPAGHQWVIMKINIVDLWLIDFFGGASILDIQNYFQFSTAE